MGKREIVHIEIPTKDGQASAKFYADMFGWETNAIPDMNYTMFQSGNMGGGFNPIGAAGDVPVSIEAGDVLLYISSDDIEADLKKIEGMGGKTLLPKSEIPNMGWFAFFEDVSGNRVGLFTGAGE